jgi:hypothetical protein
MARISIDDELHADRRFKALVRELGGDEDKAVGLLYRFWRQAQDHWGDGQLMPLAEFELDGFSPLAKVGLAEIQGSEVYSCGSEERFGWYRQRVVASKAGVEARRVNREHKSGQPDEQSRSTESDNSDNPSHRTVIVIDNKNEQFDFDALYKQYPRKVGKTPGLKKLRTLIHSPSDYEAVREGIKRYREKIAREKIEPRFVAQFSTWVNQERWKDAPDDTPSEGIRDLSHLDAPTAIGGR